MSPLDIKYIVIHCSATRGSADIGFTQINQWHLERGWSGCGYHFIIRRNGTIEHGRRLSKAGAHTKGHNRNSWGICLIGGLDEEGVPEDNFTGKQMLSLYLLVTSLRNLAPVGTRVLGHRDLSPDIDGDGVIEEWEWLKECPCFPVREWLDEYEFPINA